MKIDYDELRRIYRLEQNASQLVSVDEDFLDALNEYVLAEKKAYEQALNSGHLAKARDFSNVRKLVEEIFLLREKKLLSKALTSTEPLKENRHLFREEKHIFEKLVQVIQEHRHLSEALFEKPSSSETDVLYADTKGFKTVLVKVIQDVPSFVGSDLKEYGPFSAGQSLELPEKTALVLVQRKLAENIE